MLRIIEVHTHRLVRGSAPGALPGPLGSAALEVHVQVILQQIES